MNLPERLRLFVAARVPKRHLRSIDDAVVDLKRDLSGARWVALENQHVTLKFLGATYSDRLDAVRSVCKLAAKSRASSQVSVTGLGAFPSTRRARVLWVGLDDPAGVLADLAQDLSDSFEPLGYAAEKRAFTPHLTLARFNVPARLEDSLPDVPELERFTIDRIELLRSHVARGGARYEVLESFMLGK